MTDELLPALPEPSFQLKWRDAAYYVSEPNIGDTDVFTADQMQAYAREAIRQQWRPISEAPKDGISFLFDAPDLADGVSIGYFIRGELHLALNGQKLKPHVTPPTVFHPLPSPPAGEVA